MLAPEDAQKRLDSLRDPSWRATALDRAAKLPDTTRGIAETFLAAPPETPYLYDAGHQRFRDRQLAAGRELDTLADDDRAAVMDALHPGLGPALTRWWTDARSRPYQRGWSRKSFRVSARHPGLTVATRTCDLDDLVTTFGPFDADPAWLAVWSSRMRVPRAAGGLLASAIDLGGACGEEVYQTLLEIAGGEHPVAIMDRYVIDALLGSARREAWEFTGRLLLAAQRQEGLRQVILESADEGNPGAFAYLLDIVAEHKLLRFAAAVRAAGVWTGTPETVEDLPRVESRVRKLAAFLTSDAERSLALRGDDAEDVTTALHAGGMRDVTATLEDLRRIAAHPRPDLRTAALRYARAIGLEAGEQVLASALDDGDARVAGLAAALLPPHALTRPGVFESLARLVPRLPAKDRDGTADLLVRALGDRPAGALLPWLSSMSSSGRHAAARTIARAPTPAPSLRAALFALLGDRSSSVRSVALRALEKLTVTPDEAPAVEALLTRAAADVRRGALTLLAAQPAAEARGSAERLGRSKNKRQREAAAELLREIDPESGAAEDLRVTLPGPRTEPLPPRPAAPGRRFADDASRRIIEAIDEIACSRRNDPVTVTNWQGTHEILLGDLRFLPSPFSVRPRHRAGGNGQAQDMILGDVFRDWWASRPDTLRGEDDGLDALRAYTLASLTPASERHPSFQGGWWDDIMAGLAAAPPETIRYRTMVCHVTAWLACERASAALAIECLDAFEAALAAVPDGKRIPGSGRPRPGASYTRHLPADDWRCFLSGNPWYGLLRGLLRARPDVFTPAQLHRWHRLMRWVERPHPDAGRLPVDDALLAAAHRAGAATDGDVIEAFLTPGSRLFRALTGRWRGQAEAEYPTLVPVADRVRSRLLEVELRRGDLPTPTSDVVRDVRSVTGAATVTRLLAGLGDSPLRRGWSGGTSGDSRGAVFSHLIRASFPGGGESLRDAAARERIPDKRLVDLALYAPQWAAAVEEALDWPGLAGGVLWLHAHTKDNQWSVDSELRESWAAMIAERTPLSADDLMNGAVDVDWFRRAHEELGEKRWTALHKAAKYTAGGGGHRRAQMFAEAMLGETAEADLTGRVTGKRNQDAVRALGLLPLPSEPGSRAETTARRYAVLREFERGSREFGSQRRASEGIAVRIGIENLARTAGYADPRRFIWAVEAAEAGDLADGPVTATAASGDVTVTLSVNSEGMPALSVRRGTRTLKSVPAAARKDPAIAALTARKTALAKQLTRVRDALQDAMTAQDTFTAADFEALTRHPVVAPLLGRLVWVSADGVTLMREDTGGLTAKSLDGPLRIAHPGDMAADGTWVHWQERLFKKELRQPFKQVFRELYVLTGAEKSGPVSRRYEGHQVQPRQALALLGARGWVTSHDSGEAARVFHRHGYVARLAFADGFLTPAEADLPTIDGVYFTRPGEWLAQPLESVPPVVFSETMRDIDLIVSVAHAGGVDPEATASTVEMRAALVRETARLLKLDNLVFSGSHVLIDGQLGEYSLHLGSGTVHRRPGGALCILPVGSQHRGRLFLPFADDDPKTAEVLSKVLLLARDHQIKDPTILEQLRS